MIETMVVVPGEGQEGRTPGRGDSNMGEKKGWKTDLDSARLTCVRPGDQWALRQSTTCSSMAP